jgi:glutamate-1-semialdehyde 2,1-aminomutase
MENVKMESIKFISSESPHLVGEQIKEYQEMMPESENLFSEAQKYLPGGTTRTLHFIDPYPIFIDRGEGCYLFDVDGNSRIDFFNNATSLILGHCHPAVIRVVSEQLKKGTAFHGPTSHITELAKIICKRMPSIKKIRFTNSGSEATLLAIQLARAFTGKDKIAKFEGGYHGFHDYVNISVTPPLEIAGDPNEPNSVPETKGIPDEVVKSVIVMPFNNIDAVEKIVKKHRDRLSSIIIEPMLGTAGIIPADRQFMSDLRELANDNDVLLIFDEVQTFRYSTGGAQELYGVTPDLTTLGKIIGGGFPVGAVGGRDDIMSLLDSTKGKAQIPHGGTFNGNPITMLAGIATLNELTPLLFEKLSDLGKELRSNLKGLFDRFGIPSQITGETSFFAIHFKDGEIKDYRSAATGINKPLQKKLFLSLLSEGIFCAQSLRGVLSTPMTMKEINSFLNATENFLKKRI